MIIFQMWFIEHAQVISVHHKEIAHCKINSSISDINNVHHFNLKLYFFIFQYYLVNDALQETNGNIAASFTMPNIWFHCATSELCICFTVLLVNLLKTKVWLRPKAYAAFTQDTVKLFWTLNAAWAQALLRCARALVDATTNRPRVAQAIEMSVFYSTAKQTPCHVWKPH